MIVLCILLVTFFSQGCSQLGESLCKNHINFFIPYFFRPLGKIINGYSSSSYAYSLDEIRTFDFKKIHNQPDVNYEGVIIYNKGTIEFVQRTNELTNSYSKECCNSAAANGSCGCNHCIQFKKKLRKRIFYGGKCRVYRQDKAGNVFVDQYNEKGQKLTERFLFEKLKKIIEIVMLEDGSVLFLTQNAPNDMYLIYSYDDHKKSISDFPDLKIAYENKFPWMKEKSEDEVGLKVLNNDLVIGILDKPLWLSLFKKILFKKIIHIDGNNGLVFLQTGQRGIYTFRFSDGQFFSVKTETTPAYDAHDVSWLDVDIDISTIMQPIKQSSMGWYFGAYVLTLKTWLVWFKKRCIKMVRCRE